MDVPKDDSDGVPASDADGAALELLLTLREPRIEDVPRDVSDSVPPSDADGAALELLLALGVIRSEAVPTGDTERVTPVDAVVSALTDSLAVLELESESSGDSEADAHKEEDDVVVDDGVDVGSLDELPDGFAERVGEGTGDALSKPLLLADVDGLVEDVACALAVIDSDDDGTGECDAILDEEAEVLELTQMELLSDAAALKVSEPLDWGDAVSVD